MRVIIVAGGTGGHIYPGIAVAEALREKGDQILFIGSHRGLEERIVPKEGFEIKFIHARGFIRRLSLEPIIAIYETILGFIQSISILKSFKPEVIFSTGGYVSLPVILAAKVSKIPVVAHEPNTIAGLVNRITGRWAKKVTTAWPQTGNYFAPHKVVVTGNPVRKRILVAERKLDPGKKTVIIEGGSQGAKKINQTAAEMISVLRGQNFKVIHLTGEKDFNWIAEATKSVQEFYEVIPYSFDPSLLFSKADLIVSRAGATIISEILAKGIPSILIPFPYSAEGHQEKNAGELEKVGAAIVIKDPDLTGEKLACVISQLVSDERKLIAMSEAALSLSKPEATKKVAELLYEVASFSP